MKKSILLLFAALLPLVASAEKVEIDGIWYNLTAETSEAGVTYKGIYSDSYDDEYSGSITIPATVTHNGVQYSVTSIGSYAFYDCSSLAAITIPESVTSIGDWAFEYCSSLTDITIPENVTSIGIEAFGSCSSLTAITLPASVTSIGGHAFSRCSSLTDITIPDGVTSIGDYAFWGCSSLTAITIPENVTSIGIEAFGSCSSLTDITIPEDSKLTSIGWDAFRGTEWYNKQPDGVAYIGKVLYKYKGTMPENTAIEVKEGTVSISPSAFRECSSLTDITLPEGVTSIGNYAFEGCSSLTDITLPEGVTSIGNYAFEGCSSLKTVINYSDLSLVKGSSGYGYVAYYADRVINVDEVIDGYAFKTKEGVHYLTGYIGDDTALTLPADYKGENYQIGEEAFNGCSSLTAITIPEGVTSIGDYAFRGCSNLTTITLPEGVTSIGWNAFDGCSSLKELTLGKGLKKIAADAFAGCTALEKVTIYATRPPSIDGIGNAFFSDATYENATLYVTQGCIDKYEVMTGWSGFYTIEEMEGGTPNYLTLRQADNGEVGIVVDLGRTYKVRITAFEGWKIHSVTFNGEEVTAQLTEEGTFTTPALQGDAVLNIAYEKTEDNTMVANTTARAIKVQGHRGTLRITGTTQGEAISVYTTGGTLAAQESAEGDETFITLPTGQVYIVTVADKVVKIGM